MVELLCVHIGDKIILYFELFIQEYWHSIVVYYDGHVFELRGFH